MLFFQSTVMLVKSKMRSFFHHRLSIFWSLLVAAITLLTVMMIVQVGDGKYFLQHEDEAIYYCSAKLFAQTNSVQAEGCNEENVSPIGKINWYGPGFHVVYGTLFKIFGEYPPIFPWFHYVLSIAIIALLFALPLPIEMRLVSATALSLTQQFFMYVFTFFPETLMLFFATILTVLLFRQHSKTNSQKRNLLEIAFIICCIIFALFRITFIFWILGWVVLAKGRLAFFYRALFFAFLFSATLGYMKFFLAPTFSPDVQKIDLLYQGHFFQFISRTFNSIKDNIISVFTTADLGLLIVIGLALACCVITVMERDKMALVATVISLALLFTFLGYYTVAEFFFIKQTAMLMPLMLLSIIVSGNSIKINYAIVIVVLAIFPSRLVMTNKAITKRRVEYTHRRESHDLENSFAEIGSYVKPQGAVILWCYNEYDFGRSAEALLPPATAAKKPILYTTNVVPTDATAEHKFKVYNRLKIDYVLSRYPLEFPNVKLVHATPFYSLYEMK